MTVVPVRRCGRQCGIQAVASNLLLPNTIRQRAVMYSFYRFRRATPANSASGDLARATAFYETIGDAERLGKACGDDNQQRR